MPSALIECRRGGRERVAFVIDARSGSLFREATASLDALAAAGDRPHLLFFDASDEVLLRRYSETRHRHPLETSGGVSVIEEERRMLVELRARADKVIDTTHLTVKDLRDTLHSLYGSGTQGDARPGDELRLQVRSPSGRRSCARRALHGEPLLQPQAARQGRP